MAEDGINVAEDTKQYQASHGYDSDSSEEPSGQSLPDLTRRLADSLQKPFHCQTCSKKFASKKSLADHMRAHSGEKPFQCEICAKLFLRSGDLKRHLMMHSGEKPFQCEICQKQFPRKGNLQLHRITHTKSRPHECLLCGRYFAQKSGLTQHMLVHTGIKRFQCELCQKQFARKAYLQKHMLSHRSVPLDCEVCGKTFSASRNLKLHALSHIARKVYHCYMCEEKFSEKGTYFKHIASHDEPLECQVCFKQFANVYYLGKHSHIHATEVENIKQEISGDITDRELDKVSHDDETQSGAHVETENVVVEMCVSIQDAEEIHQTDQNHSVDDFESDDTKVLSVSVCDVMFRKLSEAKTKHSDVQDVVISSTANEVAINIQNTNVGKVLLPDNNHLNAPDVEGECNMKEMSFIHDVELEGVSVDIHSTEMDSQMNGEHHASETGDTEEISVNIKDPVLWKVSPTDISKESVQ